MCLLVRPRRNREFVPKDAMEKICTVEADRGDRVVVEFINGTLDQSDKPIKQIKVHRDIVKPVTMKDHPTYTKNEDGTTSVPIQELIDANMWQYSRKRTQKYMEVMGPKLLQDLGGTPLRHPPIVDSDTLEIMFGVRRTWCLGKLGFETLPCYMVDAKELPWGPGAPWMLLGPESKDAYL